MSNLSLWEAVATTKPSNTKKVEFGRKFTAINAHSQILEATRAFGPCGIGWGVRNSRYEVLTVDSADPHYNLLQYTGELWYIHEGKTGELDISADIELFEWSNKNSKWSRVEDTHKKVKTDALTKGLSWLGFNADVFMGLYDDNKYVNSLKQREAQEAQQQPLERKPNGRAVYAASGEGSAPVVVLASGDQRGDILLAAAVMWPKWSSEQRFAKVRAELKKNGIEWEYMQAETADKYLALLKSRAEKAAENTPKPTPAELAVISAQNADAVLAAGGQA